MLIAALHLLGTADRARTAGDNAVLLATVVALTATMALLVGWVEDVAARRPARLLPRPPSYRPRPAPTPPVPPATAPVMDETGRSSAASSTLVVPL